MFRTFVVLLAVVTRVKESVSWNSRCFWNAQVNETDVSNLVGRGTYYARVCHLAEEVILHNGFKIIRFGFRNADCVLNIQSAGNSAVFKCESNYSKANFERTLNFEDMITYLSYFIKFVNDEVNSFSTPLQIDYPIKKLYGTRLIRRKKSEKVLLDTSRLVVRNHGPHSQTLFSHEYSKTYSATDELSISLTSRLTAEAKIDVPFGDVTFGVEFDTSATVRAARSLSETITAPRQPINVGPHKQVAVECKFYRYFAEEDYELDFEVDKTNPYLNYFQNITKEQIAIANATTDKGIGLSILEEGNQWRMVLHNFPAKMRHYIYEVQVDIDDEEPLNNRTNKINEIDTLQANDLNQLNSTNYSNSSTINLRDRLSIT